MSADRRTGASGPPREAAITAVTVAVPDWVISQRRARGDCECCGERPAATEWAGTGEMTCWECCEHKRGQGLG